jgi:glycosyltransferase involved in cell wall biosynthesis
MRSISIVINNYNYGRFLAKAIDSVLAQTLAPLEIIVVDDGSTDHSINIATAYSSSVRLVTKANGGQGSAYNAGFMMAKGSWVWFLDADDYLLPDAVEQVTKAISPGLSKIHGKLACVNEYGVDLNKWNPTEELSEGVVLDELYIRGTYTWPPGSGNIYPRSLLEKCMPMPEEKFRLFADLYLSTHAAFYGPITAIHDPVGFYRLHAKNNFSNQKLDVKQLTNQTRNLYATIDLLEELFGKLYNTSYQYPYTRWNYETLLLAKRFTHGEGLHYPSFDYLHRCWEQSAEIRAMTGCKKTVYRTYWLVLRYMPKFIIESILSLKR